MHETKRRKVVLFLFVLVWSPYSNNLYHMMKYHIFWSGHRARTVVPLTDFLFEVGLLHKILQNSQEYLLLSSKHFTGINRLRQANVVVCGLLFIRVYSKFPIIFQKNLSKLQIIWDTTQVTNIHGIIPVYGPTSSVSSSWSWCLAETTRHDNFMRTHDNEAVSILYLAFIPKLPIIILVYSSHPRF